MTVNETEDKERLDSEHFSPYRADGKLVSSFLFLALLLRDWCGGAWEKGRKGIGKEWEKEKLNEA